MPTWKKVRRSSPFLIVIGICSTVLGGLILKYLLDKGAVEMIDRFFGLLPSYVPYILFAFCAFFDCYIGYLLGKNGAGKIANPVADDNEIAILTGENHVLKGKLETLQTNYENDADRFRATYAENERLKEELEALKTTYENDSKLFQLLYEENESNKRTLQENDWVIQSVQTQREAIDKYVVLERFFYCRIDIDTVPLLVLVAHIRNHSFFTVELENAVSGTLEFDTLTLRGDKYFNSHHDSLQINPTHSRQFVIEVRLTNEEKEFIEKFGTTLPVERGFKIHKLALTIKDANEVMYIVPKQVTIRTGFKVISATGYEKANEQFSQT